MDISYRDGLREPIQKRWGRQSQKNRVNEETRTVWPEENTYSGSARELWNYEATNHHFVKHADSLLNNIDSAFNFAIFSSLTHAFRLD